MLMFALLKSEFHLLMLVESIIYFEKDALLELTVNQVHKEFKFLLEKIFFWGN